MIKSKYLRYEIPIVVVVVSVSLWVMIPQFIASQNINTDTNFPDTNFRMLIEVCANVEPGKPFTKKDVLHIEHISFANLNGGELEFSGIPANKIFKKSLDGIHFLESLKSLEVNISGLEYIDVSHNSKLEKIILTGSLDDSIPDIIQTDEQKIYLIDKRSFFGQMIDNLLPIK